MRSTIAGLAEKSIEMCRTIAAFTEIPGTTTRTFLCNAMRDCHAYLRGCMEALGMRTHIDAAGNLRGLYPGQRENARRLVIGSHLDTVPNAGAFDGVLGVVLGIVIVEALEGKRLPFAIEIVGFSEEEGVRFGAPFLGSRAFTGTLDGPVLRFGDANGVSVESAIKAFGLDPSELAGAVFDQSSFAYLEFHIEQGPVLASMGQPLAVVDAISGQSRAAVLFEGKTNHAGTTPMAFRRDALAAAAEWILEVERYAGSVEGLVATAGKLEIEGAAANVIPGKVRVSLDVRHRSDARRTEALAALLESGSRLAEARRVRFSHLIQSDVSTVALDSRLVAIAGQSLRTCGLDASRITSGAGHDAMIVAPFLPSVMIFLRSPNGISHDPAETVLAEDVAWALQSGLHFLEALGSTLPYDL
jgi:allantoate deiminase